MSARCRAFTIDLNSCTCWPRCPRLAYSLCGAKKPMVSYPQKLRSPFSCRWCECANWWIGRSSTAVARRPVVAPVEVRVGDDRARHERSAVGVVADQVVLPQPVGVDRLIPLRVAFDGAGVRVEEQLRRIAPVTLLGLPGAVDPIAVPLPGPHVGTVPVPDEPGALREVEAALVAALVEEAELDSRRHLRKKGEIGPGAVVCGPEGIGSARPDLHSRRVGTAGPLRNPPEAQALAVGRWRLTILDLNKNGTTRTRRKVTPTPISTQRISCDSLADCPKRYPRPTRIATSTKPMAPLISSNRSSGYFAPPIAR